MVRYFTVFSKVEVFSIVGISRLIRTQTKRNRRFLIFFVKKEKRQAMVNVVLRTNPLDCVHTTHTILHFKNILKTFSKQK